MAMLEFGSVAMMQEWLTVRDKDGVKFCLLRDYNRLLEQLMLQEWTASALARHLDLPLQAVHHKLTRLLRAGLIVQIGVLQGERRQMRLYRAAAYNYFIPYEVMPLTTLEELLHTLSADFDKRLHTALVCATAPLIQGRSEVGLRLQYEGDHMSINATAGAQAFDLTQLAAPQQPAVVADWDILHLSHQQAKQLQAELNELHRRYQHQKGGKRYLLRLTLTPDIDGNGF